MRTGTKPNSKATVIACIVMAWMALTWIGHVSRPLLSEPLRHEVGAVVHVSEWVLTVLILGGLVVFKFWVKPRLSPEAQRRIQEAAERERSRSSAPALRMTAILLAVGVALGALLKWSGIVTDKRVLYACLLVVPPLLLVGYQAWRYRRRR